MIANHPFKRLLVICALCLLLIPTRTSAVTNPVNEMIPNSTVTGELTKSGTHAVEYWVITLDTYGSLQATLSAPTGADMNLHAISGTNIGFFNVQYINDEKTAFIMPNLAPGTYKIEVDSRNAEGSYTLSNTFVPALAHEGSPDTRPGKFAEAQPLALGETRSGLLGYTNGFSVDGADIYKLVVPSDGRLEVHFKGEQTLKAELFLYDDSQGISIKGENGAVSEKVLTHENIGAGIYFIKLVQSMKPDGNETYGTYSITAVHTPNAVPADKEVNDKASQAVVLKPSVMANGHMGYVSLTHNDQTDFYRFTLTKSGNLRVDLTTESKLKGQVSVYLGKDLQWLDGIDSTQKNRYVILNGVKPGTYYLRITGAGYGGYGIKYMFSTGSLGKVSPPKLPYSDTTLIKTKPLTPATDGAVISSGLANVWAVNENDAWTGTWTRRGNSDVFDAVWVHNQTKEHITDVLKITAIEGSKITIYREGLKGYYYGTLSSDFTRITNGTCTWVKEWWTATLK